ncbi:hypothetical protein NQ318_008629 [Aromia moschata]|uniref:DM10 domain-containing protein n=1 Tax=Aromia moschata TaxID=1265417 RepID=A0AAV8YUP1_9CUCU|nr:hypothetical protein NQ318_008629 [Aromia moschata]
MDKFEFDFNDKLSFLGEWFDYDSAYQKKFIVNYYPSDNTIEIFDRDLNRIFLKRTRTDDLGMRDMFVGNQVRIYGRQIKITGYADCRTECVIGRMKEHTLAILKPCVIGRLGEIITDIQNRQFQITQMGMHRLSRKEALELYETRKGDSSLPFILEHINSGPVIAMELVGENAIKRFKAEMGPSEPDEARKVAPNSLRAIYGLATHATSGFHGANTPEDVVREINFFFPKGPNQKGLEAPVVLKNTTCCIIKPHAIHEGKLGHIISAINESHFKITAAKMVYLGNANADEFLEVYKGVVSDYNALLLSLVDGPCVALEIAGKNEEINVQEEFRRFVGPMDSDIARQIRPGTIRARFGCDKYRNAVHCTDLPEDTVLELEYVFKILKD